MFLLAIGIVAIAYMLLETDSLSTNGATDHERHSQDGANRGGGDSSRESRGDRASNHRKGGVNEKSAVAVRSGASHNRSREPRANAGDASKTERVSFGDDAASAFKE